MNNIKEKLKFNFTISKWGGFDLGDGEFFINNFLVKLKNKEINPDFIIFTEEISKGVFDTTFIPNPVQIKDISSWTSEEWIDMFTYAITYRTTKEDVANSLANNSKIGIYEVQTEKETIIVDNMGWYFLNMCSNGSIVSKILFTEHPKTKEFFKLIKNI